MAKTILVVDDEERLRSLLDAYLSQQGFRVVSAADGREALGVARCERPDLVILDLMMPVMDGHEFMRLYRRECDTPVIILTAKVDDSDKVLGLELGADDYVTKPFSPRVLVARVRAVLRRAGIAPPQAEVLRAAGVTLDRGRHTVCVEGSSAHLTPSEFDLLAVLMSAPGRVFTRGELLDHVQGADSCGFERTVDVHVRNLRAKIEADPRHPCYIESVYGVGYRFAEE